MPDPLSRRPFPGAAGAAAVVAALPTPAAPAIRRAVELIPGGSETLDEKPS
jgi:hypothetical protein